MTQLEIDWTRCDGHGLCAALLPEAITLDEWGFPIIDASTRMAERSLRRAVGACPALALRLDSTAAQARPRAIASG